MQCSAPCSDRAQSPEQFIPLPTTTTNHRCTHAPLHTMHTCLPHITHTPPTPRIYHTNIHPPQTLKQRSLPAISSGVVPPGRSLSSKTALRSRRRGEGVAMVNDRPPPPLPSLFAKVSSLPPEGSDGAGIVPELLDIWEGKWREVKTRRCRPQ
jgi:hypothetical protein